MRNSALFSMVVVLALAAFVAHAEEPISIRFADLNAWRDPHGAWQVVSAVVVDPVDASKLQSAPGRGIGLNGPDGNTGNLFTKVEHGDVKVQIEFMVPKGSNSGVYLQGRYEIQILDSWGVEAARHSDCGGIYQRWKEGPDIDERGYEGRPPILNASRPPGIWQLFDIVFRAPRFDADGKKTANAKFETVKHNGITIHVDQEVSGPTRAAAYQDEQATGPLMLQGDHGPVAFRNLRITPLDGE